MREEDVMRDRERSDGGCRWSDVCTRQKHQKLPAIKREAWPGPSHEASEGTSPADTWILGN